MRALGAALVLVAACSPPVSSRAAAAAPAGCPEVQSAIETAIATVPDMAIRADAPAGTLMARNADLAHTGRMLVALRDRLTVPTLATLTNDFAQTSHQLAYLTASLAGAKLVGPLDRADYEHAFYLTLRGRTLARRAALALCIGDESRDQTTAWKSEAAAVVTAVAPRVAPCLEAARGRAAASGAASIKLHIGADGRVTVAGPDVASDLPLGAATTEAVYCLVRELERTTFPRPAGEAILLFPVVRAEPP